VSETKLRHQADEDDPVGYSALEDQILTLVTGGLELLGLHGAKAQSV
jgi:hypothetical protein